MPRFNQSKYHPATDSSGKFKDTAKKTGALVLLVSAESDGNGKVRKTCLCGCDHLPEGKKSKFMMGHDARYRGKLIRAHLTGTKVVIATGQDEFSPPVPAMTLAKREGWEEYLKNAEVRREGKNRQLLRKALGSKKLVKVGRWEYTGQVVAFYENGTDEYEVEYVTKTGETKRTRVPVSEAKAVRS